MTKIERALAELSELYEFYARIQERKWRRTSAQPQSESPAASVEVINESDRQPASQEIAVR